MFAAFDLATSVAVLGGATFFYLLLLFLVIALTRALERTLLFAGLITAVYAAWATLATFEGGVEIRGGQAVVAAVGGHASGLLGRVAVLLILGALAVMLLDRAQRTTVSRREESIRVPE